MTGQITMVHIFKIISLLFIVLQVSARVQTPFGMMYNKPPINIQNFGSYRGWSNGTAASSCNAYRNPATGFLYTGATGDGVYRINVAGTNYDVYCLMTFNSNGWMMVAAKHANATNTFINSAYSSTQNFLIHNTLLFNYSFTSLSQAVYRLGFGSGDCNTNVATINQAGLLTLNANTFSPASGSWSLIREGSSNAPVIRANSTSGQVVYPELTSASDSFASSRVMRIIANPFDFNQSATCTTNFYSAPTTYDIACIMGTGAEYQCGSSASMYIYLR